MTANLSVPSTVKSDAAKGDATSSTERVSLEHATTTSTSSQPSPSNSTSKLGWTVITITLLIVTGGAWAFRETWLPRVAERFSASEKPKKMAPRAVPVVTAAVQQRDMNLYLTGLGTVTALKTVTVRSRVEGELIKVQFQEGQMVHEGDLLAEIDPRPYITQRDQAAGQLARDQATLKAAQLTLDRLQTLATSKAVSTQDVDNQIALVQQTEGIIKTDQAMVANAELQLTYCKIVSPINGRVGLRLVDVGNIVRANDPSGLVVINQLEPIAIVFTISQDDIPRVQQRMREGKTLTVDAFNRDFTTKLASGTLAATDNQVDSATGTLRLKAIIDKDADALFPNQFVNTRLLVDTLKDAIVVPSAAVQRGPDFAFVYVVSAEGKAELRKVQVGPSEETETAILSGLQPGEIVVTEGLDKLQPGASVSTRDPSAQPNATADKAEQATTVDGHGKRTQAAP